ncbi:MAG: DUF2953 domain-containing protein [Oscillospiraceae bacterium]|nr:DUF2953 domain-containing protein [Oscillospiraceae bacterium]
MTALYITLGIVLFIALLLLWPIKLKAKYTTELALKLQYMFIAYNLTNRAKKEKKKPEKQPKKPSKPEKKGKKAKKSSPIADMIKEDGLAGFISFMASLGKIAATELWHISNYAKLTRYSIIISIASDDPAETAGDYAAVCGIVSPVSSLLLNNIKHTENYQISITPDFFSENTQIYAELHLSARPINLLISALRVLFKVIASRNKKGSN